MKARNGRKQRRTRKAISPIIATVLIIAITLIAAVAIGGFVFGIFGTASQSAQVAVTGTSLAGANFVSGGPSGSVSCAASISSGYSITLTNTGTAAGTVTGISLTWAGATASFIPATTCAVGAAGSTGATQYVVFSTPKLATAAVPGQTYSGTVTMSNGAQVLFTGTWQ